MKSSLGDNARVMHMKDSCDKILLATNGFDETRFENDFIVNAAVCNFIMIIGEASSKLTQEFKDAHPNFDWHLMKGMRNIIVHEYFGVDLVRLWNTVVADIPKLKLDCENALNEFE